MKRLLLLFVSILTIFGVTFAQKSQATLEIIPKWDNPGQTVEEITSGWNVWKIYREKSQWSMSLWDQFATGVMTWDTILDYAVYIIKFLGQVALLVGAVMLIYFGYQKALAKWTNSALLHVIIWILVVIFSYVIIRTIWYMFIA
jgi:hypothetical protein